jgi:hypothetical protein
METAAVKHLKDFTPIQREEISELTVYHLLSSGVNTLFMLRWSIWVP